jgi:hypothetical protein
MTSSEDRFWDAVTEWHRNQSRIEIVFSSRANEVSSPVVATVEDVDRPNITFRIEGEGRVLEPLDFTGVDVRFGGFEKIESSTIVRVFNAMWDDDSRGFDRASMTELRDAERPN